MYIYIYIYIYIYKESCQQSPNGITKNMVKTKTETKSTLESLDIHHISDPIGPI